MRLTVDINTYAYDGYGHPAELFDPFSNAEIEFAAYPGSGTHLPTNRTRVKSLEYYDSMMQLLDTHSSPYDSPLAIPAYAKVNLWDGGFFLFKLVNVEVGPSDSSFSTPTHGRLVEAKTADNSGYTITYKTWTNTQLDASPNRQWQIDTVVDATGPTLTFSYNSSQQGGEWAVSNIALPASSGNVAYSYVGGFLDEVTYPDSAVSTIDYAAGYNGQIHMTIFDAGAEPGHRRKTVALTGSAATVNGRLVPTAVGMVRVVVNGASEVSYYNLYDYYYGFTYVGGGMLKALHQYGSWPKPDLYYKDGWTTGVSSMSVPIETYTPRFYGNSIDDLSDGKPYAYEDERGIYKEFQYDSLGNVTFIIYDDSTFEAFSYDSTCNKVTRHRDRTGNVKKYVYNSKGQILQEQVGITDGPSNVGDPYSTYNRAPTDDVQASDYAVKYWTYFSSGANIGKLATTVDGNGNTTDYEYNSAGRLYKVKQPPDVSLGTRAETAYTYDSLGRLETITAPDSTVTQRYYDSRSRLTKVLYPDGSTERTVYGTSGNAIGLPVKTIDRGNVVTNHTYDAADRLITRVTAAAVADSSFNETATSSIALTETWIYLVGTYDKPIKHTRAGSVRESVYDTRGRVVQQKSYPRDGVTLVAERTYKENQLFSSEDPYGRTVYYAYDATDGRLVRTVTGTVPQWAPTTLTNAGLLALTRDSNPNALYAIEDLVYDAHGNIVDQYDARLTQTHNEYDSIDRLINRYEAYGTSLVARTQTLYDDANNVIEVRLPRYFDSSDSNGYLKAHESWSYNGRNLVATHTEAGGATEEATESYTYDLKGRQATHTDFRGKVWTTGYDSCCGHSIANENPLGHGSIRNTNSRGHVVHTATIADVDEHIADMSSPGNTKTLGEVTARYDGRGRVVASTIWLLPLGAVDFENPPIAGLDSISTSSGLTTQYLYDDNLTDGSGLDSSGGVGYAKMAASGTSAVSLANALTKLASAQASGGASVAFDAGAPGRATVVVNPQDEISFTIQDAIGRTVMRGKLDNYTGTANAILTWSTQLDDVVTTVTGYGGCLEAKAIDALGKATQSLVDGASRTIRSIDQLGNATDYVYDAAGNRLSIRDPNGVGQDVVYDALGRAGLTTDTASDTTNSVYDKAGNRISATDGKGYSMLFAFDARGRQKSQTDRLGGVASFTYLATGQLASLTDAESQTTSYTYDDAGEKLTETYPDHTGGAPGQSAYGIVTFVNDAAGRVSRRQDQKGDTCTYLYDLAGRLVQSDYRTLANSPAGTVAHSDVFTYGNTGRKLTAASGRYNNTVSFTYDSAGRKATEALTIAGQTYTTTTGYDVRGRLTSYTYPDGTVVGRVYTDRGQLYQLTHAGTTIDTRGYDNGGRMISSTYNNGVSETRSYNTDNTLASISFSGAAIGNVLYSWDDNKNKTAESISGTMSGYGFSIPTGGYDAEDRLIDYNRADGNLDQSWDLSVVGDWDSVTTEGTSQSRTHGPAHELLTAGGSGVSTDVKGNITLIPSALRPNSSSLLLNWDFDNRLNTADVGNNSSIDVTYKFDALGRRVFRDDGANAVVYVHSGPQTIADYPSGASASSPKYRYVYAAYIDEPVLRYKPTGSELLYYHRNQQYSIVAVSSASGTVAERYAYSASGAPLVLDGTGSSLSASAYDNRYLYTGRDWDSSLYMYHFRARMYDPGLGRFCSRDPIDYEGGLNLYRLVVGLSRTDPMGLDWWFDPNPLAGNDDGGYTFWPRKKPCRKNCPPTTDPTTGLRFLCDSAGKPLCRTNSPAPGTPATDGCGTTGYNIAALVPEAGFTSACNSHDTCYGTCGASKSACDAAFLRDMHKICFDLHKGPNGDGNLVLYSGCVSIARQYAMWVRKVGDVAYQDAQDTGCVWAPCTIRSQSCGCPSYYGSQN